MFTISENLAGWAFVVVVFGMSGALVFCKNETALDWLAMLIPPIPPTPSASQRAMLWVSSLLLLGPVLYNYFTHEYSGIPWIMFPANQGLVHLAKRMGLGFTTRVWLLIPTAAATAAMGCAPMLRNADVPWSFVCVAAISFAVATAVNWYSFPIEYRERVC